MTRKKILSIITSVATVVATTGAALMPLTAGAQVVCSFVTSWGEVPGSGNGQFNNPNGIAAEYGSLVYVGDQGGSNIQKFTDTGGFLLKWGSLGTGDGQFNPSPDAVATDPSGNIFAVDRQLARVQKFGPSGNFITKWGFFGTGNGQFNFPAGGITVDPSGNVFVNDQGNDRIQKFDNDGNFITTWGSPGAGDDQFSLITHIAADAAGNVYVVDSSNQRVAKFDNDGNFLLKWGTSGLGDGEFLSPEGVAVDQYGRVFVADFQRIQMFDSDGNFITKFGSPGTGPGQFESSLGDVAVDSSGAIYVAENHGDLIGGIHKFTCPPPAPDDGDGIQDSIDTQPGVFSDNFNDANNNNGVILDRSDLTFSITDDPDNGVFISVSGGTGLAIIEVCSGTSILFMVDSESASVTCGTSTVTALSTDDTIEVRRPFGGNLAAQAKLTEGQTVTISPFLADPGNATAVLIEVVDVSDPADPSQDTVLGTCELEPAAELDVTFPGHNAVLFTNVGSSEISCDMDENSFTLSDGDFYIDACPGIAGTIHGCPAKAKSKIPVCHVTGSASNPFKLIFVSHSALNAHLNHGDSFDLNLCVTESALNGGGGRDLAIYLPLLALAALGLAIYVRPRRS